MLEPATTSPPRAADVRRVSLMRTTLVACCALVLSGCGQGSNQSRQPFDLTQASYMGRASCVECHRAQAELYAGSHHDLAMQPATEATVLGDFNDATIEHHGVVSRMFRDGDKFMVHTEGPDGRLQDFEVRYVFGVEPLQQYMVEFPSARQASQPAADNNSGSDANASDANASDGNASDGKREYPRMQVLGMCWDTQAARWFYLSPPDVPDKLAPDDELHWTGIAQRWNTMCADCHSTNFQKNFHPPSHARTNVADSSDTATSPPAAGAIAGEYHSTFFEMDVSCEACHGPGSVHVELAKQWFPGWNRQRGYGLADLKATAENQIQACAPCHSRRSVVHGGFRAGDNYYDFYTNSLLIDPIYYPDGQVLDEDYVHGSFIQSKMYHKGIRCSDCHDPHTARLKHEGNAVCTSCHQHPAAKYDSVAHHFHAPQDGVSPEEDPTSCVNCHMPSTTYMEVDARRDHSLRIPRPDLSLKIGTPNACTGCHLKLENVAAEKRPALKLYQDWMRAGREGDAEVLAELQRADKWSDDACERWYGENRRRDEHFGEALAAAQSGAPDAREKLIRLLHKRGAEAPALARATALQLLPQIDPTAAGKEAAAAMHDEHPLVRSAAAEIILAAAHEPRTIGLLVKALDDPVRSVRTQAARSLLQVAPEHTLTKAGPAMRRVLAELEEGISLNNDHAGAHLDLGVLAERRGLKQQAIKHYETAIAVEPRFVGPRANLADLLERSRQPGSDSQALHDEIARLRKAELPLVERNAQLLPEVAELQYRFALALYLDRQLEKASEFAMRAAELDPEQVEYAQMTAMLFEALNQTDQAIHWAEEAVKRSGNAPDSRALLQSIRQGSAPNSP